MDGIWEEDATVLLLIKKSAFNKNLIKQYYLDNITSVTSVLTLDYVSKPTIKEMKEFSEQILKLLSTNNKIKVMYVADAPFFKYLTGHTAEKSIGLTRIGNKPGFSVYEILAGINYQALFHNPNLGISLEQSIKLVNTGESYCASLEDKEFITATTPEYVKVLLNMIIEETELAVDIETFSLSFIDAGIGTISFCSYDYKVAFGVDLIPEGANPVLYSLEVRKLLLKFFNNFKGKLIFHNANYDVKVLIYNLFMKDLLDTEGLLKGIDCLYRDFEDTKVMAYLCYNSTIRPDLSLKTLSYDFMGDYGIDVTDITKVPLNELLEYNILDTKATLSLYSKYKLLIQTEGQLDIYNNIYKPSIKVITQMELTGMPLVSERVTKAKEEMNSILVDFNKVLKKSKIIKNFNWRQQIKLFVDTNTKLKRKVKDIDECKVVFNPSSGKQIQELLYEYLNLPILDTTDKGSPSTSGDTIKALITKLESEFNLGEKSGN